MPWTSQLHLTTGRLRLSTPNGVRRSTLRCLTRCIDALSLLEVTNLRARATSSAAQTKMAETITAMVAAGRVETLTEATALEAWVVEVAT
jgi:hypothetical protein